MKTFGAFPPDRFLPKTVRAAIDKLMDLRERCDDSQENLVALRAHVGEAETADIMEAANAIVAGKDEEPGSRHQDAAVAAVKDAERRGRALKAALPRVNAELQAAFTAAGEEIRATADAAFEQATGEYVQSLEALATARSAWLVAVAAKKFAHQATQGTGGEAHYVQPDLDAAEFKRFRDEATADPAVLFAPPARTNLVPEQARIVQGLLIGRKIPSRANGNELTVLADDYDRAIAVITSLSDWYADGDGITRDFTPPDHITVVSVPALTDAMRYQSHWLRR